MKKVVLFQNPILAGGIGFYPSPTFVQILEPLHVRVKFWRYPSNDGGFIYFVYLESIHDDQLLNKSTC